MHRHALAQATMDTSRLRAVREEMERAEARRLQPHFIESFFLETFRHLGGTARQREPRRYRISHVPAAVRRRAREMGTREPVPVRYERIALEKSLVAPRAQPQAAIDRTEAAVKDRLTKEISHWEHLADDLKLREQAGLASSGPNSREASKHADQLQARLVRRLHYSLNKPDDFILAIVEFLDEGGHRVHYLRRLFRREPDFVAAGVLYDFSDLLARAAEPS